MHSSATRRLGWLACLGLAFTACTGEMGPRGGDGTPGSPGEDGDQGEPGEPGEQGDPALTPIDPDTPLSAMVAISFQDGGLTGATNIADYVKGLVQLYADDALPGNVQFPLAAASTDSLRTLRGLHVNTVVKWLDRLTYGADPVDGPLYGANTDYLAYFGDGWDSDWVGDVPGSPPQWNGDDTMGYIWANHEYISNDYPSATSAPTGQAMTLARYLYYHRALSNDVTADVWDDESLNTFVHYSKKQHGGSWLRVVQDPSTGEWEVDRAAVGVDGGPGNIRYDGTSDTLLLLSGIAASADDHDDAGNPLPAAVVAGIMGDCSGGQTPWGTVITAEENVQAYYGDLESTWTDQQQFIPGSGFDPGADITYPYEASPAGLWSRAPDPNASHNRDFYGYLSEIDVGRLPGEYDGATTPGVGHKKLGQFGRARWENATFVTDASWQLIPDQPIVFYAGNDRRSGRIYKFVSAQSYTAGMTRAQIRALLDDGTLYVAHFADLDNATGNTLVGGSAPTEAQPGNGRWIELSTTSTDIAPNAAALGEPTRTVGAALVDIDWNSIGGFPDDDHVRWGLFTAAAKVGVMELNRPEDLEWNPLDPGGAPRLYVAFTNSGRKVALDQDGVLYPPDQHDANSPLRPDPVGALFAIDEADPANPAASTTFTYFDAWHGSQGEGVFDAANPDNILIDIDGGVWFGTDGNFGTNGKADGLYYLDLDPAHQTTPVPTYGLAFRVIGGPSDAEATGPAFTPGMGTLFFSVQHPGEFVYSSWPPR